MGRGRLKNEMRVEACGGGAMVMIGQVGGCDDLNTTSSSTPTAFFFHFHHPTDKIFVSVYWCLLESKFRRFLLKFLAS
jgi:hypothetical protein